MAQKAYTLDTETRARIWSGALRYLLIPASLGILSAVGAIKTENQFLMISVAYIVPLLEKTLREYKNGN